MTMAAEHLHVKIKQTRNITLVNIRNINISYNNRFIINIGVIFRTLEYLMPEIYSKSCQVSKMMTLAQVFYCEFCEISKNTFSYWTPPVAASNDEALWEWHRTVYSGMIRHTQRHSAIFNNVQAYCGALRHTETSLRHIEQYSDIFRTLHNLCINNRANPGTFRAWRTCKIIRHIQSPAIVNTVHSSVFKDI